MDFLYKNDPHYKLYQLSSRCSPRTIDEINKADGEAFQHHGAFLSESDLKAQSFMIIDLCSKFLCRNIKLIPLFQEYKDECINFPGDKSNIPKDITYNIFYFDKLYVENFYCSVFEKRSNKS